MVKSILSVSHRGLRDWVWQRLSALMMASYTFFLLFYFFTHPHLSFDTWHGLMSETPMKIATLFVLFAILIHAWVGMWTIFTDYVKPFCVRACLNLLVFLLLSACFLWGFLILWSV